MFWTEYNDSQKKILFTVMQVYKLIRFIIS